MKKLEYDVLVRLKDQINAGLDKVKKTIKEVQDEAANATRQANGFGDALKTVSWLEVYAGIEVLKNVADGFNQLSGSGMQFQQSIADLSAITGIAGDELKQLESDAQRFGVVSGKGASAAADSYKTLASQIEVSKIGISGLNELQERTVTLAQASGMGMNDSAMALAGTINQFGLAADQANRVINVLAAGSKYGAAEIPELAQSFKVVGAAANAAGLSVEQTAGALEVLSKNNQKGAEAGTSLRNILLKMQTELGVDFGETNIAAALEALKPKLNDATYLSKLFGMENVSSAQFLITNAAAVEEMTQKITGTNVAHEQAEIRMNTTQARMEQMRAKIDNLKIGFFDLTGGVSAYMGVAAENVVMLAQMMPLLTKVGTGIMWITKLENLKSIAVTASIGVTKMATIATAAWNAVLNANPIMFVVTAIGLLVSGLVLAYNKFEGFRRIVDGTWSVIKSFGETLIKTIVTAIKMCIEGLGALGSAISSLFKGEFAKAGEYAKEGVKKIAVGMAALNPVVTVGIAYKQTNFKEAYEKGANKATNKEALQQDGNSVATTVTPANINLDGGGGGKGKVAKIRVLPEVDVKALQHEIKGIDVAELPEINTEGLDIPIKKFKDLTEKIWGTDSAIANMNRNMSGSLTNMIDVVKEFALVNKKDLGAGVEKTTMQMQGMAGMMSGMAGIMGGLSGAVGESAAAWLSWGANLLSMVATALPELLALFGVQSALAVAEQAKLPFPLNLVAMGATVAGITAAMMSIPKPKDFANGGIVYGETFARVGEYSGASTNPEVIAPLNKLKAIIGDNGGSGGGMVEFKIKGRNLEGALERNNRYNRRRR